MESLESILHYTFRYPRLLKQALTHSSVTADEQQNYERLEFLGDRVLGMTLAHLLYNMYPEEKEGELAQRHTKMVRAETVAKVVKRLNILPYIVAKDEGTKKGINVLCDVGEAIIGAIYIDSNIENAIEFVERNWKDIIEKESSSQKDAKSLLQETFHILKQPSPTYKVISKEGTEHEPLFTVRVNFDKNLFSIGRGRSKKLAEQNAAADLLTKIKIRQQQAEEEAKAAADAQKENKSDNAETKTEGMTE